MAWFPPASATLACKISRITNEGKKYEQEGYRCQVMKLSRNGLFYHFCDIHSFLRYDSHPPCSIRISLSSGDMFQPFRKALHRRLSEGNGGSSPHIIVSQHTLILVRRYQQLSAYFERRLLHYIYSLPFLTSRFLGYLFLPSVVSSSFGFLCQIFVFWCFLVVVRTFVWWRSWMKMLIPTPNNSETWWYCVSWMGF